MEMIELDEIARASLKKEVFNKLHLIKKYVYKDENFAMLIKSLDAIHRQSEDRVLDFISFTNDELVKRFGKRIPQETAIVYYSSVLWEWFYLIAYYIHKQDNDPLWREYFLPHIKSFQIRSIVVEETEKGEKLIDEYIARRGKVLEMKQEKLNHPDDISSFYIAEGAKTDVMKVLSYLYDLNVFVDQNNQPLKRKKSQFMVNIGKFLHSDFENYAQAINKAAQEDNFREIFYKLGDLAEKKYLDGV